MRLVTIAFLSLLLLNMTPVAAQAETDVKTYYAQYAEDSTAPDSQANEEPVVEESEEEEDDAGPSVLHRILLYIPNRILDVLDIVRARARIGPGVAVSVRVTDAADLFLGGYITLYVGLPGPRNRTLPKSPIWFESYNGAEISYAEGTATLGIGPDYSFSEIGAGAQVLLVGADVGVDPVEILDFLGGFFFWDPREDDI